MARGRAMSSSRSRISITPAFSATSAATSSRKRVTEATLNASGSKPAPKWVCRIAALAGHDRPIRRRKSSFGKSRPPAIAVAVMASR